MSAAERLTDCIKTIKKEMHPHNVDVLVVLAFIVHMCNKIFFSLMCNEQICKAQKRIVIQFAGNAGT